jgi:hypothetical protein
MYFYNIETLYNAVYVMCDVLLHLTKNMNALQSIEILQVLLIFFFQV